MFINEIIPLVWKFVGKKIESFIFFVLSFQPAKFEIQEKCYGSKLEVTWYFIVIRNGTRKQKKKSCNRNCAHCDRINFDMLR